MLEKEFNVERLHQELTAAGLMISGVTCDGRIDWIGKPTDEMLTQAEQIKVNHTVVSETDAFRLACRAEGLDSETILTAIWAKIMEGDSSYADQIQAAMNKIKADITAIS